ncbi:MAG TPA: hypothetical protein VFB12_02015 [Ktedonobacteraceae bacterium]|nr:hypothetical protein [Ktedonobacteraceae bacterium]
MTPELAQPIAAASLVVMIDASREGEPGKLRLRPLFLPGQPGPVGTHSTPPEELAALPAVFYGHCPLIVVAIMTGAHFGIGEQLSSVVTPRIPCVCEAVQKMCTNVIAL